MYLYIFPTVRNRNRYFKLFLFVNLNIRYDLYSETYIIYARSPKCTCLYINWFYNHIQKSKSPAVYLCNYIIPINRIKSYFSTLTLIPIFKPI